MGLGRKDVGPDPMAAADRTVISVCVCTFRRPAALARLLASLGRLDPATPSHEIIVVDNDAARGAERIVEEARRGGLQVQYLVEPVRGLARVRNRAVGAASGEFVAFIDDDEEADPAWLVELWRGTVRYGADGAIGHVASGYNTATPGWLVRGRFFERRRIPTGTPLDASLTRTGNALVRRGRLSALAGPFDVAFDHTGSEDTDLFRRLIAGGARFVAVESAVVVEHLTSARTTARWLLRRRYWIAMGDARFENDDDPVAAPWLRGLRYLARALAWGAAGAALFPFSRIAGLGRLQTAARLLGRAAFHFGFTCRPYLGDSWV
jgi:succinoglycan biosynthesis protein ExoM